MSKRILFLVAAVALLGAGIYERTTSARSARHQADQIVSADAAATDTHVSLDSLKTYVRGHMGASVSFTLKASYDRTAAAAQAASTATNNNSQIYADAQKACGGKSDSITQAKCNQAYLSAHLTNVPPPVVVPAPKLADYQYNLKAPFWTPDLAGALFLGALVALGFSMPLRRRNHR